MPLNPNIILSGRGVQTPSAAEMIQLSNLGLQNKAAQGQLAAAAKQARDATTLADLYKKNTGTDGAVNDSAMVADLAGAGLGSEIPGYQKSANENAASRGKLDDDQLATQKKRLDIVNGAFASLLSNPQVSHDEVISAISGLVDNGIIDPNKGAQMVKSLPGPNQLRQFLTSKAMESLEATKRFEATMPKASQVDTGGAVQMGVTDPITGAFTPAQTIDKTATPGQVLSAQTTAAGRGRTAFTDDEGALMAALAERGISLPSGLRSREQMKATFASLLSRNPDSSPDDIAEKIATGQININAERKETMTAAAQAGKVAVAVNELQTFGDLALEASSAMPRGTFVPWNKLKQMAEETISDPALLRFKVQMTALNNAYDALAARGGTDMEKRAKIAKLFSTANSPESVKTLVDSLKAEGIAAEEAARKATQRRPHETEQAPGKGTGSTLDSGATVSNWN